MPNSQKLHDEVMRKMYIVDDQIEDVVDEMRVIGRKKSLIQRDVAEWNNKDFNVLQLHLQCIDIRLACLDKAYDNLNKLKREHTRILEKDIVSRVVYGEKF